jgi:hypothetical protein
MTVGPLQRVGVDGVRPRTNSGFRAFGRIGYEMRDVRITACGYVGFAYFPYRVSGSLVSGEELGMWNRATFCFRKIDGRGGSSMNTTRCRSILRLVRLRPSSSTVLTSQPISTDNLDLEQEVLTFAVVTA